MKLYDLGTAAAFALLAAFVAQGQHTPDATLADCDRVAVTGDGGAILYFNLVDATCGAAFPNDDAVLAAVEDDDADADADADEVADAPETKAPEETAIGG